MVAAISVAWALFQLSLPRLVILDSVTVRAIHLAFAMVLVFLTISITRHKRRGPGDSVHPVDYLLAAIGCLAALYIVFDWTGITMRSGIPSARDVLVSIVLIVLVLCYLTSRGTNLPVPKWSTVRADAAGSMQATASDMAAFLIEFSVDFAIDLYYNVNTYRTMILLQPS